MLLSTSVPVSRVSVVLLLVPVLAASGCFRSVTVRPRNVTELRVEGESAHVVYRDGHTLMVDGFDELTVETKRTVLRHWPQVESKYVARKTYDFGAPVTGALTQNTLELRDGRSRGVFARDATSEVEFSEFAPERGLIIFGATVGSALLLGAIGASVAGSPSHCVPEDTECYDIDIGGAIGGLAGGLLGAGLGLAISIPLTGGLGQTHAAPHAPTR